MSKMNKFRREYIDNITGLLESIEISEVKSSFEEMEID